MPNQNTGSLIDAGKIRELYALGMSQAEIARSLGCSQPSVCLIMKRVSVAPRPSRRRPGMWTGENSDSWAGESITYKGAHIRVNRMRGRAKQCEDCKTTDPRKSYDWANLTGEFHDIWDYKRLCRNCHRKFDRRRRVEATRGSR